MPAALSAYFIRARMGGKCWWGPCSTADQSRKPYSIVNTTSEKNSMNTKMFA